MNEELRDLYDPIAESGILGAFMVHPTTFEDHQLRVLDFYLEKNRIIFQAMEQIHKAEGVTDYISVQAHLAKTKKIEAIGGTSTLVECLQGSSFGEYIKHHAAILKEFGRLRILRRLSMEIEMQISGGIDSNKIISNIEHIVDVMNGAQMGGKWVSIEEVARDSLSKIDAAYQSKELVGVTTGLRALDEILGGLQKTDLIIVGARPSMGKTGLAIGIADRAALVGHKVGIISLEMSNSQLGNRILARHGEGLTVDALRQGHLTKDGWISLTTAAMEIEHMAIHLCDDSICTLSEVRAKAKILKRKSGLDLLIIDYLQLMSGEGKGNRETDISGISRGLKQLAKQLDIPILALSQLSRELEKREDRRPIMADLRESGAIEQDADVILMIYRDEVYNPNTDDRGKAEIIIRKHRNGAIGDVHVNWLSPQAMFID